MNNPYLAPAEAPPAPDPNLHPYGYGTGGGAGGNRAEVSDMACEMLRSTKPWVTFLSVMSFIGSAFMLLGGLFVMAAGALVPKQPGQPSTAFLGAIYIPMAFLYIYPAIKLWAYGSAIGRLLNSRASFDLEAALAQQKSFWKFAGITTIVMIALYGVFFIGVIVVGITAASSR